MKILSDTESPPGGWKLTVPQTGTTLHAPYAKTLRVKVLKHLDANDIEEPENFDEWFDEEACAQNDNHLCGEPAPVLNAAQKQNNTPSRAKRFLRTVLAMLKDRKLVSREEAERRAAICIRCPMASHIGSCWNCYSIFRAVRRQLKGRLVEMPKEKRWCMSCGCYLPGKLLIPNSTLDKAEKDDPPDYANMCWRNESSSPPSEP